MRPSARKGVGTVDRVSPVTVLADRYELGDALGSGGMAQVFRAHDRLLGREVAVKLFGSGIDPNGPARARSEMRTLAALSHPNLVAVHDAGTDTEHDPPRVYLVMQLIDGPSLADLLKQGPLPPGQVQHIGIGVAHALAYVHQRGVVHRDIKPGNILLDSSARPFLADFGIAQTLGASALTATGLTMGTAAYLSPEQVRGHDVGPGSDTFAFGLVLLEALTGQREYDGTTAETALARLTRPPALVGRVPKVWCKLLAAMTATDPAERPTALQVADLLEALPEQSTGGTSSRTTVLAVEDATLAMANLHTGASTKSPGTTIPPQSASADVPDKTRVLAQPTSELKVPDLVSSDAMQSPKAGLPRVQQRPAGPPRHRRHFLSRVVAGAAVAALVLAAVIAVLSSGSGSSGSPIRPAPAGTSGPGRLSPDLSRLQQLVKP